MTFLVTTAGLNTNATVTVNKILDITNLATKFALDTKAKRLKLKYLLLLILLILKNSTD